MNKDVVMRLLSIVSNKNNGCITFDKEFKDNSAWSAAFMHNISTKVFDYNAEYELFKKNFPNEDKFETDENNVVTKICRDVPLIRCKDFSVVQVGDKLHREDKFIGRVNCKFDEDYRLVHVWFSNSDNDDHYFYLGCLSKYSLEKFGGVVTVLNYAEDPIKGDY